jgi:hypothetical protein
LAPWMAPDSPLTDRARQVLAMVPEIAFHLAVERAVGEVHLSLGSATQDDHKGARRHPGDPRRGQRTA